MDKNTAIWIGVGLVAVVFVLPAITQPQPMWGGPFGGFGGPFGGPGFGPGRIGPDGFPLPEDRVIGVLAQLTALGGQIYDTVQSRRGTSGPAPTGGSGATGGAGYNWGW